jgi:Mce-associated membrane protein
MSTNNPRSRRRIAGERKTPRAALPDDAAPAGPTAEPAATRTAEAPRPPRATDRVGAPAEGVTPEKGIRRPGRPAPRGLLAVLAALATVLVLTAALLALLVDGAGWGDWKQAQQQDEVDRAMRTAPAAAERAAAAVLTYDYRTLEADRDAAAALMTPEYREQYLKTFELVMDAAPARKARVEADVRASGVSLPGDDRVEVLLFVNQTTVSTASSGEPQIALNRVVFTMERDGEAWRVDGITSY